MSQANLPPLSDLALKFLRSLEHSDFTLDGDDPQPGIALAQSFGTNLQGLAEAQQELGQHGLAVSTQVTNSRIRSSITQAGRQYLQGLNVPIVPVRQFKWWNPATWF